MNRPPAKKDAKAIFSAAIEYYTPEQWEAYIVTACGEDESLRQRVRELLDAHRQSDSFFDRRGEKTEALAITERPGTRIGPYKLLQEIGEGGFGVVYMAEQVEPVRRKVALKIIKPGMDTKQVIARFEAERQALAMMDHPNIAKVLDAGATESGRPYFVMELVKGVPITEFCDANKLPARDRLELFVTVCRAVQHAHQKGLIHRDLKPTNVMVTLHDNKPMPVIIDFGVSKAVSHQLTEKTLFTAYGQMVGTPAYMSPEQAQMSRMDIDTRSDIYSLGVLLYELLTGSPEELPTIHVESIRREVHADSLEDVWSLLKYGSSASRVTANLLRVAAEMYFRELERNGNVNAHTVRDVGMELAKAIRSSRHRDELVAIEEKVARAAWDAGDGEHGTASLASGLIAAILANDNQVGIARFVQQELPAQPDAFGQLDRNSDGEITSTELPSFWTPQRRAALDKNSDNVITADETGDVLWKFFKDADRNEDGAIASDELRRVIFASAFHRLDRNRDGQLSDEEITTFRQMERLDTDDDRMVSEKEFVEGFLGFRFAGASPPTLTPEEQFLQNDHDGDSRVSEDEADATFWNSIAEFDTNGDDVVDLKEYEAGLLRQNQEKAEHFFSKMDRNCDGQASQDEVPRGLWDRWLEFDENRDGELNRGEFMEAQSLQQQSD